MRKGKPLYIEGYLKTRSWDSPEGIKVFRTEIVVKNLVLLGAREASEAMAVAADAALIAEPVSV